MQRSIVIASALALSLVGAAQASASPITWLLEGKVSRTNRSDIALGESAFMQFTFDSAMSDLNSSSNCGQYNGGFGGLLAGFGSYAYNSAPSGGAVEVNRGGDVCGNMPSTVPGLTFRTFGLLTINAFFENGPILTDSLLLAPPDPTSFKNSGLYFTDGRGYVIADMSSARVVPEPSTLMLLGMGAAGLIARSRRAVRARVRV